MKTLKSIYTFLEFMGRAKAAGVFARAGDYKAAQAIMTQK